MKKINNNIYLKKFIAPIRVSAGYRPKFGLGKREEGIGLDRFLDIYGRDPFYAWCGLDSKLMYAAHKAAGGMTSIYRQIGKGCENLFKEILIKSLQYGDRKSADWSYVTKTQAGKEKRLSLDGRIEFRNIKNKIVAEKIKEWTKRYCDGRSGRQRHKTIHAYARLPIQRRPYARNCNNKETKLVIENHIVL